MIGALRRLWDRRGRFPSALRSELEVEGLELCEERLQTTVFYRDYLVPGQRMTSGHRSALVAIALTGRRLLIQATGDRRLEVPRGERPIAVSLAAPDRLRLTYEASAFHPSRSGTIEMEVGTPRAAEIHAALEAWFSAHD